MVASVKRNFVHIIVFAFAVVIIIIIIIITCSDPTARIIMLKVLMSQSFLFPYAKELSRIIVEEWCLLIFILIALLVALLFKILFYAS